MERTLTAGSSGPTLAARWLLAQELGIRGIAIWRIGSEDPQNWAVLHGAPVEERILRFKGEDGWIVEERPRSGTGGRVRVDRPALAVGDNRSNRQFVSLLSFDTAPIPDSATLLSAILCVRRQRVISDTVPLGLLRADLMTGAFGNDPALAPGDFEFPAMLPARKTVRPEPVGRT